MDANPCHVENARLNIYKRRVSEAAGRDNKQTNGVDTLSAGAINNPTTVLHNVFKQYCINMVGTIKQSINSIITV